MSKDIQLAISKALVPSNIFRIITRYLVNPKEIRHRKREALEIIEDITFTIKSLKKNP